MRIIYICDKCGFLFERSGECDACPVCGTQVIREALPEEKEAYLRKKNQEQPSRGGGPEESVFN